LCNTGKQGNKEVTWDQLDIFDKKMMSIRFKNLREEQEYYCELKRNRFIIPMEITFNRFFSC